MRRNLVLSGATRRNSNQANHSTKIQSCRTVHPWNVDILVTSLARLWYGPMKERRHDLLFLPLTPLTDMPFEYYRDSQPVVLANARLLQNGSLQKGIFMWFSFFNGNTGFKLITTNLYYSFFLNFLQVIRKFC